jgi:hypothetical protein
MENFTNTTTTNISFDCEDLSNNGLYMIFIGYIVPLFSPTMRSYMKDIFIHVKNVGKVSGEIVSLTEFGFTKVQKIHNLEDMATFIERICKNKNLKVMKDECLECAKSFAGGEGFNEGSWNKLLVELEDLHSKKVKGEKP